MAGNKDGHRLINSTTYQRVKNKEAWPISHRDGGSRNFALHRSIGAAEFERVFERVLEYWQKRANLFGQALDPWFVLAQAEKVAHTPRPGLISGILSAGRYGISSTSIGWSSVYMAGYEAHQE